MPDTTTVGELGEFGVIDRFVSRLGPSPGAQIGPGDDAAVIPIAGGRVVVSTDALIEGRHFRRDWSGPQDVGTKAAAQAIADIAAMGAVPTGLLLSLGVPPDLAADWLDGLADGLRTESARAGTTVVGGDVVRSDAITLALTALGELRDGPALTRSGAQVGDQVAIAGRLGWAAAGLLVLSRGFRSPIAVVNAHRRPEPPYAEGPHAARLGATAMCDVSDGLVQDLGHIARASGVQIALRSEQFTVPEKLRDVGNALGFEPMTWLLEGGEDHALAATFPAGVELPEPWLVLGSVTEGEGVTLDGEQRAPAGFDHFR